MKERINELKRDVAELQEQLDEKYKTIDNMSEQQNNPYVKAIDGKNDVPQIEYKTLFNEFTGGLDVEVSEHLNEGWQPAGPQFYAGNKNWFVQPLIRVPRAMMPQVR